MKRYFLFLTLAATLLMFGCKKSNPTVDEPDPPVTPPFTDNPYTPEEPVVEEPDAPPVLDALLVYHNYTSYGNSSSVLYTYDFKTNVRQVVNAPNAAWSQTTVVQDPMNASFSPDGKDIVFMGIRRDGTSSQRTWCIFKYTLGASGNPSLLCVYNTSNRDEDPKYNHDGTKVYFKRTTSSQTSVIFEADMTKPLPITPTQITPTASKVETGMPFCSPDGKHLLTASVNWNTNVRTIDCYNFETKEYKTLYVQNGLSPYYPIGIDNESFYFSSNLSAGNLHDQIYKGFYDGRPPQWMPFNLSDADTSDACQVNDDWVITSTMRSPNLGGYDLWIMHTKTKAAWSLSTYNSAINTNREELGACIYLRN